jgi:2-polyprenyl-6-methoxyphenol hydroxylase-like FAD-dependent oxidoreductase
MPGRRRVAGSRVGVIGGSIAGCAAGIALGRAGCDVTIYERSRGELQDRGSGIGIPASLREELTSAGYFSVDMPFRPTAWMVWMVADAGTAERGRVAWRQPYLGTLNNWGVLWRTLRARLSDDMYRHGVAVADVRIDHDGATILDEDGQSDRFDVVACADGYRSTFRRLVDTSATPVYAGYALFRGDYPASRLSRPVCDELERDLVLVCYPGGYAIFYLIPDFDAGQARVNWGIYTAMPEHLRFEDPVSLPRGSIGDDLAALLDRLLTEHMPTYWADVAHLTDRSALSLQPIYDATVATYVADPVFLIGDAGTVTRPHTASGATKALQDALALERACRGHMTWERALAAYDAERRAASTAVVELGRRLGRALVEAPPTWTSMTAANFEAWWQAQAGQPTLYAQPPATSVSPARDS